MTDRPRAEPLPYREDGAAYFQAVADEPWAVLLDSGPPEARRGRYDIVVARPVATLITRGEVSELARDGATELHCCSPFDLIRETLSTEWPTPEGLPFAGGWVGAFGYDLARRLERLPSRAEDGERTPELVLGLYDWAVVVDHERRQAWLATHGTRPETVQAWGGLLERFRSLPQKAGTGNFRLTSPVVSNLDRDAYGERFRRIKAYLRAGDCYQVNLARRFAADAEGDSWQAYQRLRRFSPAPYGAYLRSPHADILSNSPERFLHVRDGRVETRPIKGTRPRGRDEAADRALAEELSRSPKDRAENVMIVDLLRNDLGRVCRPGSVRVPRLFELESFPTVHHLVSTVTGELAAGQHALDLLRACFPGGSITGAPKIRAMEIIEELEPHRRGVYCGAIGYIGFDGAMDTNIAIRTLVRSEGRARFWAGGGVVIDSGAEQEYQESFDKAAAMLALLEAIAADG